MLTQQEIYDILDKEISVGDWLDRSPRQGLDVAATKIHEAIKPPMKRYLLFFGDIYYANGGMDDFRGDFDTVEEAIAFAEQLPLEHLPSHMLEEYTKPEQYEQKWFSKWYSVYDTVERIECASLDKAYPNNLQ
jgi:hypothetical protein